MVAHLYLMCYFNSFSNLSVFEWLQSPERMKTKLKFLELEFEEEMKQKTERLKPRLIGCIWIDPKNTDAGNVTRVVGLSRPTLCIILFLGLDDHGLLLRWRHRPGWSPAPYHC